MQLVNYHERKARQAEALLQQPCMPYKTNAGLPDLTDWSITAMFYYALHWLRGYLKYELVQKNFWTAGRIPNLKHESVFTLLQDPVAQAYHKLDKNFYKDYEDLFNLSLDARYEQSHRPRSGGTAPRVAAEAYMKYVLNNPHIKAYKEAVEKEIGEREARRIAEKAKAEADAAPKGTAEAG